MNPKEQRIQQVKNKIEESKKELKKTNQYAPLAVACIGLFLMIMGVIFIAGFGIGFIMVLLSIIWAFSKSHEAKKFKDEIFKLEGELYNLEKEP